MSRSWRSGRRLRAGALRVRVSLWPIAWVSLAAGVAYWSAGTLLDHQYPFFAAVAAFSALGFSPDIQPRQVGEVALGISVGVGLGELIVEIFGAGPLQMIVVVFFAATIGRLLDPSKVLTTQSAVQSIVVVGLPAMAATGGPVGRWTDALVGGLVALIFSLLVPHDPRRRPRRLAESVLDDVAGMVDELAGALQTGDAEQAEEALDRGRSMEPLLAEWSESVGSATSTSRMSPAWRRFRFDAEQLARAEIHTDRAIRTLRVLARRLAIAVQEGHRDVEVADLLHRLSLAVAALGPDLRLGHDPYTGRGRLLAVAHELSYDGVQDPVVHALIALTRSTTYDLLRVTGLGEDEARAAFP